MYYAPPAQECPPRPRRSPQQHAALIAGVLMLLVFAVSSFVLKEVSFNGEQLLAGVSGEKAVQAARTSLSGGEGETLVHTASLPVPPLAVAVGLLFLLVLGSMAALVLLVCGQFCYTRLRRTDP